jgi:hypothetical protein
MQQPSSSTTQLRKNCIEPLTPAELQVWNAAVRSYCPPLGLSVKGIMAAAGMNNVGNVHRMICSLERKGYLRRAKASFRARKHGIVPIVPGAVTQVA